MRYILNTLFSNTLYSSHLHLNYGLNNTTTARRIFNMWTGSMALRFAPTGAPLAVKRIRILPMNQHAWRPITLEIEESYWLCGMLDGCIFHGDQCGSCMIIWLWFISSGRHLSAPLVICSQLKLVSSVIRHGAVYFRATCVSVWHVKCRFATKCRRKFRRKFLDEKVPSRQTIHNSANKLRWTRLLIDKIQKYRSQYRSRVFVKERLDDVGTTLEHIPRKSVKYLAQKSAVSKSSARRATQLLKIRPYKTTAIHALQPCDPVNKVHLCS
jgi:hypothetical protein